MIPYSSNPPPFTGFCLFACCFCDKESAVSVHQLEWYAAVCDKAESSGGVDNPDQLKHVEEKCGNWSALSQCFYCTRNCSAPATFIKSMLESSKEKQELRRAKIADAMITKSGQITKIGFGFGFGKDEQNKGDTFGKDKHGKGEQSKGVTFGNDEQSKDDTFGKGEDNMGDLFDKCELSKGDTFGKGERGKGDTVGTDEHSKGDTFGKGGGGGGGGGDSQEVGGGGSKGGGGGNCLQQGKPTTSRTL